MSRLYDLIFKIVDALAWKPHDAVWSEYREYSEQIDWQSAYWTMWWRSRTT